MVHDRLSGSIDGSAFDLRNGMHSLAEAARGARERPQSIGRAARSDDSCNDDKATNHLDKQRLAGSIDAGACSMHASNLVYIYIYIYIYICICIYVYIYI